MHDSSNPKLALVLGSGGVRSIAALGVAEVLWREGIAPDLVVGCSAGAMFGALIALGHSAAESVKISTTLWTADVTRKHRLCAIPQMLWPKWGKFDADFSLRDDRLILSRLKQAFGDTRFEDLGVALRVSATDAATGDTVVISQGRLIDALRASIAMPFMFAPHQIEARRVIDGFVSDPLPVSAASDAHAVIAMGFNAPMPQRINGPSRLLAQVTSAMTNNLMNAKIAVAQAGGMRLLRISPTLERRIGLFDTQAMPYVVEEGRKATEMALPKIYKLLERKPELLAA